MWCRMNIEELYKKDKKYLVNLILNQRTELKILNSHKIRIAEQENLVRFWYEKYNEQVKRNGEASDIYEKAIEKQKETIMSLAHKCLPQSQ